VDAAERAGRKNLQLEQQQAQGRKQAHLDRMSGHSRNMAAFRPDRKHSACGATSRPDTYGWISNGDLGDVACYGAEIAIITSVRSIR
jgi:hypothetical protein